MLPEFLEIFSSPHLPIPPEQIKWFLDSRQGEASFTAAASATHRPAARQWVRQEGARREQMQGESELEDVSFCCW